MDRVLARDVREAKASNKLWVAKLNLAQSAASGQSTDTRAEAMLRRRKATAAKRTELVTDLKVVVRALEDQDAVRLLHSSRHTAALSAPYCSTAHCCTRRSTLQHSPLQHSSLQSEAVRLAQL